MIDGDVERVIKAVLDAGLTAASISAVVLQSYNPTRQGTPSEATVVFTKITARRFGFQGRKYVYVPGAPGTFSKTEPYFLRPTYQISALLDQDPTDLNSLSAYDVIDICAAVLQSTESRATFLAAGIGIDRITDIRTPKSIDDSDRHNVDASFDVTLSYKSELTSVVPEATVTGTLERV